MNQLNTIPTPFFLYDLDLLDRTLHAASSAAAKYDYKVHYAIKANNEQAVCRRIRKNGFGLDCVSGNEIAAGLKAGFPASAIVFAGVGKSDEEILFALDQDIFCLNCESLEELEVIADLAAQRKRIARVALRVNPDVDAGTHKNITTGLDENKFGIHLSQLQTALDFCYASEHLVFLGLHVHIGSQIRADEPFINLAKRLSRIWQDFQIDNYNPTIINLGGGLGIDYENPQGNPMPDFDRFFALFSEHLDIPTHIDVHFELGRSLVGQSGSLYAKVLYVKQGVNKKFVIADAGMTELLRPALYQAVHKVENLTSQLPVENYDVVGPACESSDVFARDISLPQTQRGDMLAIRSCGAYAQSMSLHYNLRPKASAYYVKNGVIFSESTSAELSHHIIV